MCDKILVGGLAPSLLLHRFPPHLQPLEDAGISHQEYPVSLLRALQIWRGFPHFYSRAGQTTERVLLTWGQPRQIK